MIRRLPLRTRLFVGLTTVAVLPLLVFGLFAAWNAGASTQSSQQAATLAGAQLAASEVGASGTTGDAEAERLAAMTGGRVTIFAPSGEVLGTSDRAAPGALPPGYDPAAPPGAATTGGTTTAFAPVLGQTGGRPLAVVAVSQDSGTGSGVPTALAVALVLAVLWAVILSFALAGALVRPVTEMAATLDRLQAGDLSARLPVEGDDELARLAESHNRLADALSARNRSLHMVLEAIATLSPREGVEPLVATAERAATQAFGFLATEVTLGADAMAEPEPERIPGEAYTISAPLELGDDMVGRLTATLRPTSDWSPADEDLLRIFGSQLAAAIRSAELYADVATLSELKSEFLRGVSHNLQTPLTSIRGFAESLSAERRDRRLDIIVEQSERLSRLVDQLLTVAKLEAGTLRPNVDVFAMGALIRRVWESLRRDDHPFSLDDAAGGWLVAADRDWVEQVVWALLDNAIKYGGDGPIEVRLGVGTADDPHVVHGPCLVTTVRDHGPGIPAMDRDRIFERFTRLERGGDLAASGTGTGLGLSVARGLTTAMHGDLWLADGGDGAAFAFSLPAERAIDA